MQALIGQRLSSDINLAAQVLILIGLWAGFFFARRKDIPRHQAIQTTMVAVNSFFILFVMFTSFYNYVIAGGTTTGIVASLMIAHGVVGLLAELTGIYLILRMSTKLLPASLRVRNFKLVMRVLLGLWTLILLGGFGIYYYRYLAPKPAVANPVLQLVHAVEDVQIHVDEMSAALQRGNLATAKRHAEHVVNLIVGKNSPDYGDVDGDGEVEDPGDGTGAVIFLERARQLASPNASGAARVNAVLDQISADLIRVASDAKDAAAAPDAAGITQKIADASALDGQMRDGPDSLVAQLASAMGVELNQTSVGNGSTPAGTQAPANPSSVTVLMVNFEYSPKTVKVKAGTTLVFVNRDADKHTVTSDSGKFDSGEIDSGASYTLKLDEPGVYPYFCKYHGDKGGVDMAGTIEVTP